MREQERAEEHEEETRGSRFAQFRSNTNLEIIDVWLRILFAFLLIGSAGVKILHWVLDLPYGPSLQFLQIAFVCLLASIPIGFFLTRSYGYISEGIGKVASEPYPLRHPGYFVATSVVVSTLFVFSVLRHTDSWRTIQILACITVAFATTDILVRIGRRQPGRILRYGYYVTAVILGAEALMVMLLGGGARNG
ncbi:hypothetical protein [Paraburkholderia terrae]